MARELVPLKVKILLKTGSGSDAGQALYPDFNSLPCVQASGMDWSRYIDTYGIGWHFDATCGHKEETIDSPYGQQWGCLMVPEEFVDQAVATFPDTCEEIHENDFADFWDNKAHCEEPDELIDDRLLAAIKLKQDLGLALTTQQTEGLDPNNDVPGIRKNRRRTWATWKTVIGVTAKAGRGVSPKVIT